MAVISEFAPLFTRISTPVSVPAEMSNHAMYVNVMVNGRGPYRMFVDTGCSVTVISPELAAAVGAISATPDANPVVAINALGDSTDIHPVLLKSIDVGGVAFEGVTACVANTFDRLSQIDGRRVDGMLGFPLFSDLYLALDFPNKRILLSNTWPEDVPPIRTALPMTEHDGVPFVQIKIQGLPVEVMIDTGFNQDLQLSAATSLAMHWKEKPRPGSLFAVFGEADRESIGRLMGNMNWGGVRQAEPTTTISSGLPSIGVRFLQNFCVVFHESEDRVWLCSAGTEPIPSPIVRSIGLSLLSDKNGWRVAGIIPGSPAASARIKAGELITHIEGQSARSWTRDQLQHWINTHDTVTLAVEGNSGDRDMSLRVWSLVP
jgi:predicted aspartyl protease